MRSIVLSLLLALTGCAMTPEYVRPEPPIAVAYPHRSSTEEVPSSAGIGWRSMFGDARLQALIEAALKHNRDLRIAMLNVEATAAQYRIQRAGELPAVNATAGVTRERSRTLSSSPSVQRQVSVGFGVTAFEFDLWGRARSLSDAAYARYLASDEGRRAARLSLIAAVADAYFAERLAVEQQALATQTLESWTEQRDLAVRLHDASQTSGLDVAQAQSQVARAQVEADGRARELERARNALVQLVGADLQTLNLPDAPTLEKMPVRTQLAPGLPSDLLVNRPDIGQAEQALRAAHADIGAARAAFIPRIELTTTLGFASPAVHGLFGGGNRVWSFAPTVTLPLFDAGRLRAELQLSELRRSAAVAEYERVVQVAFREVADGLAGTETFARQVEAQQRVVAEEERRAKLAGQRYRAGLDARLEWLDAQRQAFAARMELLSLRREALGNAAQLYKALGGGLFRDDDPGL
ncbi:MULTISPECIES: efflux transporter outer membrane subunit [unclassified Rubrivivax]|uniref:efflux transporter outer membrane subunit n=1 Tax=unclassified Rubrivivax TaxID=2649762 RepID=UPI001E5D80FC|nr:MULTISPECIES: efflux transporter outer membrane subunit [unclassified Rubrivivax]MCC9597965.1 efflux transporter outer membrane subunit [Rubrivivax sp. JA1055]MCC9645778.1 efflux transporter outer membrane subunit [Rubrivivax sp. JA1029]